MPLKKPQKPKPAQRMTTDEAMARLFHPEVIEHAKRHAHAEPAKKGRKVSTDEH
jgi:hypothetical protein